VTEGPHAVSGLLHAWARGDVRARDDLLPLVYRELKRPAAAYLRHERADHTLQPTALVHEAFLRLVGQDHVAWQNRGHFFGIAAAQSRCSRAASKFGRVNARWWQLWDVRLF